MVGRRFLKHRLALVGLSLLVVIALAAALAPYIAPYEPSRTDLRRIEEPPSVQHLLGTCLLYTSPSPRD